MAAPDLKFLVDSTIRSAVNSTLQAGLMKVETEDLSATNTTLFQDPALAWKDVASYRVIVLPASWLGSPVQMSDEAKAKIMYGACRIVFWDVENSSTPWSVPTTLIPKAASVLEKEFLLRHVCRFPTWGLTSVMPEKTKIFTERISDEKQIARKIDQTIDFIHTFRPELQNHTLRFRSSLTCCFAAALSIPVSRRGGKPPVFQIGVYEGMFAFSLRWKSEGADLMVWQRPDLHWRSALRHSQASLVQINPETLETEILLLFTPGAENAAASPLSIDLLTTGRLTAAKTLPSAVESFDFEFFEVEEPKSKTDFKKSDAPSPTEEPKENPQLELTGLRVEHQKLEKQFKAAQAQMNENVRKMGQAIEAEKAAQTLLKSLNARVESAKDKEAELNKKLTQALEQIQKLKSSKGAA